MISAAIVAFFVRFFSVPLRKRGKIKQTVNGRNVLSPVVSDPIIFAPAALFSPLVGLPTNQLAGLFLGIGLFVVACIVISLNAQACVRSVAEKCKGFCPPVFRSDVKR